MTFIVGAILKVTLKVSPGLRLSVIDDVADVTVAKVLPLWITALTVPPSI